MLSLLKYCQLIISLSKVKSNKFPYLRYFSGKNFLTKVSYFENINLCVKFQIWKFSGSKDRQFQIFGNKYLLLKK